MSGPATSFFGDDLQVYDTKAESLHPSLQIAIWMISVANLGNITPNKRIFIT
jgi:hypothetical protein